MTTQQKQGPAPQGGRSGWHEVAGGAHAVIQSVYVTLLVIAAVVCWIVRSEVASAHNEDRFAAIDSARQDRRQADTDLAREISGIHAEIVAVKLTQVRIESKLDDVMRGKR